MCQQFQLGILFRVGAIQDVHQQALELVLKFPLVGGLGRCGRLLQQCGDGGMLEDQLEEQTPAPVHEFGAEHHVKPHIVNAWNQMVGLQDRLIEAKGKFFRRFIRRGFRKQGAHNRLRRGARCAKSTQESSRIAL